MPRSKRIRITETEADIQKRIVQMLEVRGWLVYENRSGKMNALASRLSGGKASEKGTPDLFCWGHFDKPKWGLSLPIHFAVEVKRPGAKLRLEQLQWAGEYTKRGFMYVEAHSEGEVVKALQEK